MPASLDRRTLLITAGAVALSPLVARANAHNLIERAEWATYFADAGTKGVIAFAAADEGGILTSDLERCNAPYLPASTFKIPNALIALESGVVSSVDERFEWDGKERAIGGKPIAAWNRSQTLRDAFRNSTVWVFQEVARRVGQERMARFVDALGYGNRDIGGAPIDKFWLVPESRLRITALQQIAFVERLWADGLPAKPAHMASVREIMLLERLADHALFGKTGWAPEQRIGWFVGVVERQEKPFAFALNLDHDGSDAMSKQRIEIVKRAAADLKLL
jgi:beta-lactamase class D